MPPKNTSSKKKGPVATLGSPSPLQLYKRALAASASWTPLNSARFDTDALNALLEACRQLQSKMGFNTNPSPPTPTAGPSIDSTPPANGCGGGGATSSVTVTTDGDGRPQSPPMDLMHPDPLSALSAALDSLSGGMLQYKAVVRHNLDLDLDDWQDEPGFLLACCHLALGKLFGRMWPRREGHELSHLTAARRLFPNFVEGGVALAQALLSRADSQDDLQQAEQLLVHAIRVSERLAGGPLRPAALTANGNGNGVTEAQSNSSDDSDVGDMLLEVNAACRREWEAGDTARRALSMLLCQAGRDEEAAMQLGALEYTHRLARAVLHYPLDPELSPSPTSSSPSSLPLAPTPNPDRYVRAVDGGLPPALLDRLRSALAPGAAFWTAHGYGRVGYFSYMHALDSPHLSIVHQVAALILRIATPRFPELREARYAEWWAHCRRHPSGHQLHFDSDDEGAGGVRNPIISSVIYLTGCVGGPTLVTPQLLGGPLAPHGWLVHPREGRLCMFDASVLHGVIPGRGPSPRPGEYRITLMIAFWRDIQCRPRDDGLPGPSQPFPVVLNDANGSIAATTVPERHSRWVADVALHPEGPDGWGTADPRDAAAVAIDRVWERLDGSAAQPGGVQYDACFQGF